MQSAKGNSKKPVAQVKKPILKGSWHGKDAWKLALDSLKAILAQIPQAKEALTQ